MTGGLSDKELAFCGLMALGWTDVGFTYKAIWGSSNKFLKDSDAKTLGKQLNARQNIKAEIENQRSKSSILTQSGDSGEFPKDIDGNPLPAFSKEVILWKMNKEYEKETEPSKKSKILTDIATINGLKREQSISDDDPMRFFLPGKCSLCNLFAEAVESGKVKKSNVDNWPEQ